MKKLENDNTKMLRNSKENQEDIYRILFESVHDGIYRSTPEGKILTANPALVRMLGYDSEEELKELNIARDIYYSPGERDAMICRIEKEGKLEDHELALKRKDGSRIIVLENSYPVYGRNGELLYYEGTLVDITSRKIAEDALKESEERYHTLVETIQDGLSLFDLQGRFQYFNRRKIEMLGYENENELIQLTSFDLIHPDDREKVLEVFQELVTVGAIKNKQLKILRKDGSWFWAEFAANVIYGPDGEPKYIMDTMRDITERKKTEDDLGQERALLRKLIDNLPSLINIKEPTGRYILNNVPHLKSVGVEGQEETRGKTPFDFFPREEAEVYVRDDMRVISTGIPIIDKEECAVQKDTMAVHWYLTSKIPLINEKGNVTHLITVSHDISERKKTEQELIIAKEKAEESDRLKTAFLHNISHEIRTPLNAIVGFANLLETPGLSDNLRKEYVRIINQSSKQLLAIISDIVEISNIETGRIKVSANYTNIGTLMKNIEKQYRPVANQAGINFRVDNRYENENINFFTDETKTIQIISNLLNNAFKFTPAGGVVILGCEPGENKIMFYVKDTGQGIEHKYHQKIFERFYQIDRPDKSKPEGTGLGLAICKAYVEILGGEIGLKSEPGKGSEFFFTLPVQQLN